jgi:ketosteroid isomerase-like protein
VATAIETNENVALARKVFGWFADGDMDSLIAALSPDVRARPLLDGAPVLTGRDAVTRWWSEFASLGGDLELRPLEFEARGDCVVVRGYMRHRAGRTLAESQVHWLYEISDGRIVRMESHPSRKSALASC